MMLAQTDTSWFNEIQATEGSAFSLAIKRKLHEEKTPYQTIAIYETLHFGNLMTIDGILMLTSRDNFIYHEMMAHFPLFTHPEPKRVVIIGGGDCGTLREVLKHDTVKAAHLIDIDERVTRLSEQYFPELCAANHDPRVALSFINGIEWMAKQASQPGSIDLIIVDSTDPIGPGEALFTADFYRDCFSALTKQGLLVQQSESPLFHKKLIQTMRSNMTAAGFVSLHTAQFPQPTYPSGWWSLTLAGKESTLPGFREKAAFNKTFTTHYYNKDIHLASMAIPECLKNLTP
ncbi:MAG: spermidine synthase [Gammaproteobacteria bacterium]|jgi:spermidine synthase|nr:spermidine synthase [Gammaproteobacteria bacterium]